VPSLPLPSENAYGHTKKLRFILDTLNRQRARKAGPLRVLDFGCGNGAAVTRYLAANDIELHGVDIHSASLDYARSHFGSDTVHFHSEVPSDLTFDAIVYADVLEHLDAPAETLRAHARQLEPEGVVVGAIPNGYGPFEIEHKLERVFRLQQLVGAVGTFRRRLRGVATAAPAQKQIPYNHDSGHLTFFTRSNLERTLAEAGLSMQRFGHGSLFCGPWSTPFMSGRLSGVNTRLADSLPHWLVSVWYFEARCGAR
jgi:2-polyprenyl-3-methyl-5-hydroxy-6-metoxy-1,4-benzoquinol methylase